MKMAAAITLENVPAGLKFSKPFFYDLTRCIPASQTNDNKFMHIFANNGQIGGNQHQDDRFYISPTMLSHGRPNMASLPSLHTADTASAALRAEKNHPHRIPMCFSAVNSPAACPSRWN